MFCGGLMKNCHLLMVLASLDSDRTAVGVCSITIRPVVRRCVLSYNPIINYHRAIYNPYITHTS
jgi:hypothetical protein